MIRMLVVVAVIAAAATGAIFANLALLDYAAAPTEPVGRLTPRANLPAAPADVVRPRTGTLDRRESDD
jgi:hypothetical protein